MSALESTLAHALLNLPCLDTLGSYSGADTANNPERADLAAGLVEAD
jgi:hypothetical protein